MAISCVLDLLCLSAVGISNVMTPLMCVEGKVQINCWSTSHLISAMSTGQAHSYNFISSMWCEEGQEENLCRAKYVLNVHMKIWFVLAR